ncbi:hypothetical protein [Microbacterium xanthum]|uniref:hypothetical protein n=1 Tax=Microbacterium xanthum TaxID=3079794 RepID=UPI002AD40BD3|nr:hypothetical protein [Microbacterium sp. KSW-48]MDZ8172425.1 hypothetical protein [Microbacterium sp. KSW-48]
MLMLSLGPLVPGHFMLVAGNHYQSAAELPLDQVPVANRIIQDVLAELQDRFGEYTAFEHGRAGACVPPGHGEDHCYHAHVHFLPKDVALGARVQQDYELTTFDGWLEFQHHHSSNPVPYLAVWEGERVRVAFDPNGLPHHYLRTKVAEALGEPLFGDWAAFPRMDDIESAKQDPRLNFLREMDLE